MEVQRAKDILAKFNNKNILVVGDVMLDDYVVGAVERMNPEAPVPILQALEQTLATGGAGNTAKNAAMLGAKTTLIGVVGKDRAGEDLQDTAKDEKYHPIFITDKSRSTTLKRRYVVKGQQLLRVDWEQARDVPAEVEKEVIAALKKEAKNMDVIIVSDYAKGTITKNVATAVLDVAKELGIPVMADVKPSRIGDFCGVTYISPNRKEAHEYLGSNEHERGGKTKEELAEQLRDKFQTSVFLTLSEEGMFAHTNETAGVHIPQAHNITIADTSGCGDTAAVVLLLAKLAGATDVEAGELGNAAGAVIATKVGAVAATQSELLDMIENNFPQ